MERVDVEAIRARLPTGTFSSHADALSRYAQTGSPEALWFFNDESYTELLTAMGLATLHTEKIVKIYYENIAGHDETYTADGLPFAGPWPTLSIWNTIADLQSNTDLPNNYSTSIVYDYDDTTFVVLGTELDEQPCICADCATLPDFTESIFGFSCEHEQSYTYSSNHWTVVVSKGDLSRVNLAKGTIEY